MKIPIFSLIIKINNINEKSRNYIFIIDSFYVHVGDFHKLKGIEYPLLRILIELIGIVLILDLILHKKELIDENRRKLRIIL